MYLYNHLLKSKTIMATTEYFSSLKKADKKKIESVIPASVQKGKTLYRRTDKNGVMSYFQLPASIVMTNDLNFKYEKCKSIADEKEFLSKTLFGDSKAYQDAFLSFQGAF